MGYFLKNEIIQIDNPLLQEIKQWEARIDEKEKELAELSEKIQNIKIHLNIFSGEYNSRVGIHYVSIDKIDLQIKEYRERIKKLKEGVIDLKKIQEVEKEIEELFAKER